jgi:hypothetical protein
MQNGSHLVILLPPLVLNPGDNLPLSGTTVAGEPQFPGVVLVDEIVPFSFSAGMANGVINETVQQRIVRSDVVDLVKWSCAILLKRQVKWIFDVSLQLLPVEVRSQHFETSLDLQCHLLTPFFNKFTKILDLTVQHRDWNAVHH